jgi:MFS family permease
MKGVLRPLADRDVRLLLTGSTVSLVGDGIYSVAMAVAALRISNSASALAAVAVANLVPRVVFGLYGGVLADRVSRRLVLLACDLVRAAVVAVLGAVLLGGTPPFWLLLVLVVPLGAASGAAAPAFSAILPDLVEADELVAASSLFSSVGPLAQMVAGPVLGGVLASVDVALGMFVDAATFAVSAGCILALRPGRQHDVGPKPLPWAHFREGLGYVRRTPWLFVNLFCGLVITFAISGALTMLPFLVTSGYGASASVFGYLLAVGGAAATLSAIAVGSRRPPRRPLVASYSTYVVGLAAVAGLGLAPGPVVAALFVVVLFVGASAGNIFQDSVLGSRVPRELRGRVSSLDWVAATAATPASVVLVAASSAAFGIRATYVGAGLVAAGASAVGLLLLLRSGEPVGDQAEAAQGRVEVSSSSRPAR